MIADPTDFQPFKTPCADAVTVAVLSAITPDWLAPLAATGARVLCIAPEGAALLPLDQPDILIIDAPQVMTSRRIAQLIAQLRWGKPDLVVLVADGMAGRDYGFHHDLSFDPVLGDSHVEDAFALARHLLCHSRLRLPVARHGEQPAVLRRTATRRANLFR